MRDFMRTACVFAAAITLAAATAKPAAKPRGIDPALVAGEVKSEGDYRWALVSNISAYEMWHASDTVILSTIGTLIRYYEFDWEVAPRDAEWVVQGIVLVGTGDTKAPPVAVKLWSKQRTRLQDELSHKLSLEGQEAVAIFTPSLTECTETGDCGPNQFRFSSNAAGEVFVGTTRIGSLK
ncbi:MAG: hypothetical protein AB7E79_00435 [Rhodospirillaceae bacterium]